MPYLGNTPTTQSFISGTDYFNGTGAQTAFTLTRSVASINDIQVTVNNVVQQPNDAYTISGTTLTMTSAPSAGTNNVYVRYLSTTTQSITPSQGTVGWNTLDSNVQGDLGISFKNRIINGAMTIDQRNAGASVSASGYTIDRWQTVQTTAGKLTSQQQTSVVPVGFTYAEKITSTSAYSVTSGDVFTFIQAIEGYNVADLGWGTANAKTVTLSFQVYSSLTGTFGGSIGNGTSFNRSYPFTYSIPVANTWTTISITIVGDTTGTWDKTNGNGMYVNFGLGVGSTFSGTAGVWASADYRSATGATSVVGTNGATFYITGVQLEKGTQATSFEYRQYGQELALCQRYFAKSYDTNTAVGTATRNGMVNWNWQNLSNFGVVTIYLPVRMRAAPTSTNYNPDLTNTVGGRYWNGSAEVAFTGSMGGWSNYESNIQFNKDSTNSTNMLIQWTASAEL